MTNPKYPVYVISKGRWVRRQTTKTLERMNIPYRIVVEPQEYEEYAKVIDQEKILVLPFSNLGQGGIPARNWVWEHSISEGHARHWILDDNIENVFRYNNNSKIRCTSGTPFRIVEEFVERYTNVPIAGMNYAKFCPSVDARPPVRFNTRVYSCILIQNDLPMRWRGRYNEDTDLCLRVLKSGQCTVMFNAFLIDKRTTMVQGGGNSEDLYKEDGRMKMAKSLYDQHPDIVQITWKFNRWQHQVDYTPFENNFLIRKPDWNYSGVNNFGLKLVSISPEQNETDPTDSIEEEEESDE